jgi:MoaA/NifB/PqqE/SkfB family radical SAM enzyme
MVGGNPLLNERFCGIIERARRRSLVLALSRVAVTRWRKLWRS